jgi:hypothetical protein
MARDPFPLDWLFFEFPPVLRVFFLGAIFARFLAVIALPSPAGRALDSPGDCSWLDY